MKYTANAKLVGEFGPPKRAGQACDAPGGKLATVASPIRANAHCVSSSALARTSGESANHPSTSLPRQEDLTATGASRMCAGTKPSPSW